MSTITVETSTKSKRRPSKPASDARKSIASRQRPAAAASTTPQTVPPNRPRVTKQELVLTLLNRSDGASIEDMMQATDWQQHSVRGFLAGTVKKKFGFKLSSSKATGDVRRYRIETRRGR